jgi:hypothetical protein
MAEVAESAVLRATFRHGPTRRALVPPPLLRRRRRRQRAVVLARPPLIAAACALSPFPPNPACRRVVRARPRRSGLMCASPSPGTRSMCCHSSPERCPRCLAPVTTSASPSHALRAWLRVSGFRPLRPPPSRAFRPAALPRFPLSSPPPSPTQCTGPEPSHGPPAQRLRRGGFAATAPPFFSRPPLFEACVHW